MKNFLKFLYNFFCGILGIIMSPVYLLILIIQAKWKKIPVKRYLEEKLGLMMTD